MNRTPRIHKRQALRLLLLCGYCFFFAGQFNYRYYCIANNFVYRSITGIQAWNGQKTGNVPVYCQKTQNPAHLGIDKRFSYPSLIKPDLAHVQPPLASYIIVSRKALPPPVSYPVPLLPANAFRGPPAA